MAGKWDLHDDGSRIGTPVGCSSWKCRSYRRFGSSNFEMRDFVFEPKCLSNRTYDVPGPVFAPSLVSLGFKP